MKIFLSVILGLISVFPALSQTPTDVRSDAREKPTLKNFGSSLKRYENENQINSENSPSDKSQDEETIRVKTDLVVSDVLVVNEKGNVIAGLKDSDFIVSENNVPQKIEMFSAGENVSIPLSIVLIIDRSGSLFPYLKNSYEATKILIDKLSPRDRMAIVDDNVNLVIEFTSDKILLKKAVDKLKNEKHVFAISHQYSALLAVLNEMFDDEDVRPVVIVQSDGDEVVNLKREPTDFPVPAALRAKLINLEGERAYGYQELLKAVKHSRATIYSIIPGVRLLGFSETEQLDRVHLMLDNWDRFAKIRRPTSDKFFNEQGESMRKLYLARQKSMFEIANLSGGYTDFIEKPEDAQTVYSTLFTVLGNRYVVGYYPLNQEANGKRRNVKVEVRGHPEYIVTGRKFYYAQ